MAIPARKPPSDCCAVPEAPGKASSERFSADFAERRDIAKIKLPLKIING